MGKHLLSPFVFWGVLIGALVGTLVVPGLGTLVGVVVGGTVGFIAAHRRKGKAEVAPPPLM